MRFEQIRFNDARRVGAAIQPAPVARRRPCAPQLRRAARLVLWLALAAHFPAASAAPAGAWLTPSSAALVSPIVSFGASGRRTLEDHARARGLPLADARRLYAASGLVVCGGAHGAGQLTVARDVITTAAHVLFDDSGALRADCAFEVEVDGRSVRTPIDRAAVVAGSRKPYAAPAVDDWAVARLVAPVAGVEPYGLAPPGAPAHAVEMATRGHFDWGDGRTLSLQLCTLYGKPESAHTAPREFACDCETGDGASGGAALTAATARGPRELVAILVGWRSKKPHTVAPFSATHYNFTVSVDGAFRAAVMAAAKR